MFVDCDRCFTSKLKMPDGVEGVQAKVCVYNAGTITAIESNAVDNPSEGDYMCRQPHVYVSPLALDPHLSNPLRAYGKQLVTKRCRRRGTQSA